jgi:hypothetical protein
MDEVFLRMSKEEESPALVCGVNEEEEENGDERLLNRGMIPPHCL